MAIETLVIGASGLIGRHLLAAFEARGERCRGTRHAAGAPGLLPLDVRSWGEVGRLFGEMRPRRVLYAAGLHGERFVREGAEAAHAVNVLGVHHVTLEANRIGALVVLVSSAEVFSGERDA